MLGIKFDKIGYEKLAKSNLSKLNILIRNSNINIVSALEPVTGALHPLDQVLLDIRSTIFGNFVKKWSAHSHDTQAQTDDCNLLIVFDGNWKIFRDKCAYDNIFVRTPEFEAIPIGCTKSPISGSYFCVEHASEDIIIRKDGQLIKLKPGSIKISKKCKYKNKKRY